MNLKQGRIGEFAPGSIRRRIESPDLEAVRVLKLMVFVGQIDGHIGPHGSVDEERNEGTYGVCFATRRW